MNATGTAETGETWISQREALKRLGVSLPTLKGYAKEGIVRARMLPGAYPKYDPASIDRLLSQHTFGAPSE